MLALTLSDSSSRRMLNDPATSRLIRVVTCVFLVLVVGAIGYATLEGWSLHDGLYMTVITLSTVGYGETHELSPSGRVFTSSLIFICIGTMAALFGGAN